MIFVISAKLQKGEKVAMVKCYLFSVMSPNKLKKIKTNSEVIKTFVSVPFTACEIPIPTHELVASCINVRSRLNFFLPIS